ncbi:MAG TPA: peptidase domain-containing ABC transporter [Ktedonobacteraceae bacterium]|nr:peptidase domain-containing ABC transporter [Ktedonobacteraceae bacterium]
MKYSQSQYEVDSDVHRKEEKRGIVPPRLSLPSHGQKRTNRLEAPTGRVLPFTSKHHVVAIKDATLDSSRPVNSLRNAIVNPAYLFPADVYVASEPRLPALPDHYKKTTTLDSLPRHPAQPYTPGSSFPSVLALPVRRKSDDGKKEEVATQTPPPVQAIQTPPPVQAVDAAGRGAVQKSGQESVQSHASSRKRRKRRRVPELRQMTAVECGAACLAMALNYYGYATSISDVQERCGVGRDGLSASAIAKAARQYGFRVRAISLKQDDFGLVSLPAIVHWEFNHFVMVERWSKKYVYLVDPAQGRRRLTLKEFDEGFTGIVIMLEPGEQFMEQKPQRSFTLWSYTRSLLQMRGMITQVLGASLLLQILGLGTPVLTAVVIDYIIPAGTTNLLLLLGIGMLLLLLTQGVTMLLRASLLIYVQTRIDKQMMLNFFEHLLSLPYRFFQMRLNGDLLARVSSNAAIRDLLTNQVISTLLDSSTVVVYFLILLWQSSLLALVAVAVGVFQVGLLLLTGPAIRRLMQRNLAAQGKEQGYLNEALAGIATIKAAGAEQQALDRWTNLYLEQMNISLRSNYLQAVVGVVFELLHGLSPLLLLWVGAIQVMSGKMPVGTMLALNSLALAFLTPLSSLATTGQKLQIAQAHFERLADVLKAEPEQDVQQVRTPPKLTGRIEIRNVSFQYAPTMPWILNDLSVNIRPGQKVALVGKTGSGKSTLGKLCIGLMTPTKGTILFDGIPLQTLNYREVRSQFGVVLQEAFIFSGSVRENIALNHPAMDMQAIVQAAQAAAIHDDIEKMPMGYETLVSEGGSAFSGGQRQRLALARALAHHPAILLLDEATSALDVTTERAVEQNLHYFNCTQIVIAHRLSTIRNADLILVLDQGKIVEQGSHDLLMRRNGYYAKLIQTQIESGEIEAA